MRKVCWTSLQSGRSPHDGGQRFFTLALSWKSYGFSDYCKADVGTINVLVAVVESHCIILHLFLRYRRLKAYVASRRIILLLFCLVGRVKPYMATRRITLHLLLRYRGVMAYVASRPSFCSCFASSVASCATWRRVASLCSCIKL